MDREGLQKYSYPVHRSIMKRRLVLGVPLIPLVIVIIVTGIILMDFKLFIIIPISILVLFIMKEITKHDEYLLEIYLESLFQPDNLD